MVERYSVSAVWSILMNGSEEPEEVFDVQVGLTRLETSKRNFLLLLTYGYTAAEAMRMSGIAGGNQTRVRRDVLRELTGIINGN